MSTHPARRKPRLLAILTSCVWLFWLAAGQAAEPLCSADIDGNGRAEAGTDGLLIIRHLFGFSGSILTQGAVAPDATRSDPAAITAYLQDAGCAEMLDVDRNGITDALTDGLLINRYLSGYRGEGLIEGAVGQDSRADASSVETHVAYYSSPRSETLLDTLEPGESVATSTGLAELKNTGADAVEVEVIEGSDAEGNPVLEIRTSAEGVEVILPDPNQLQAAAPIPQLRAMEPKAALAPAKPYVVVSLWSRSFAWFARPHYIDGYNRLPDGAVPDTEKKTWLPFGRTSFAPKIAYELRSACSEAVPECYQGKEPVLFIHGYSLGSGLGGFEGTWADFPRLVQEVDRGNRFVPFEFRWSTSARFQDVARQLAAAIYQISGKTGRQIHLVAHSFGGLLVRTLLQGWMLDGAYGDIAGYIASVSTLGTPHSGIADTEQCLMGAAFPGGQDRFDNPDIFETCGQLSCQQAGEDMITHIDPDKRTEASVLFGVLEKPGELVAGLASTWPDKLPAVPIRVLIGLTTWRDKSDTIDPGDALITGHGQRFLPGYAVIDQNGGACNDTDLQRTWGALLDNVTVGQATVSEVILGFPVTAQPGGTNSDPANGGYRHSTAVDAADPVFATQPPAEPHVVCDTMGEGCIHHSLVEVLNWMFSHSAGRAPYPLNDTGITACADDDSNNLPCPVAGYPGQDAEFGRDITHDDDSDGHAGFSFTKLDANGNALSADATNWSCVRDNVTGLTWEVKTEDGGLRDRDWTYSWFNPDATTNGGSAGYADDGDNCFDPNRCDTAKFVADVNAAGLCGASDWRLPSVVELLSVVSNDRWLPAIDTNYFPNTTADNYAWYWSSAPDASDTDRAWFVFFNLEGYVSNFSKIVQCPVRLVRTGQ